MLLKTSTPAAPWNLIEGNDKYWARVKALRAVVETLSRELDYKSADPLKSGRGRHAAGKRQTGAAGSRPK
jgi:Polyphosphate kinase 2 (PPK2)